MDHTLSDDGSALTALQVSASSARSLIQYLVAHDIDEEVIYRACELDLDMVMAPDARIPLKRYHQLWDLAIAQTGDEALALRLGKQAKEEDMGLVGHIFFNSATLEQALRQYQRYYKIVNEGMHIELNMDDRFVEVEYRCDPADAYCIPDMERTLAVSVHRARELISPQLHIEQVNFQHAAPTHHARYEDVFPCPVRFSQPHAGLVFQRRYLDYRLPNRSSYLHKILVRHVEGLIKKLKPKASFKDQVKRAIASKLAKDCVDAEHIADKLCMSRNTLYRKLKAEHVSFHDLVDEVRERKAIKYLKGGKHSLSEIAFLLGFSELSAFSRAFKRWTGDSPAAYQKKLRQDAK